MVWPMTSPHASLVVIVIVIVDVIVVAPVVVAALVNGNDTVGVIHTVDDHSPSSQLRTWRRYACGSPRGWLRPVRNRFAAPRERVRNLAFGAIAKW
jgi:hypothetical protein